MQSNPQRAVSKPRWHTVACVVLMAIAPGCTNSNADEVPTADASTAPTLEACMMLPSVRAGARLQSDHNSFEVTLTELDPNTPSLGDNSWDVAVRSSAVDGGNDGNAPVSDAQLSFSLWMPEHAHGSLKTAVVEPLGHGQYHVEPLSFHMPGIWEVTLHIESSVADDQLLFETCVVP